jgi:hypothetical protein
MDVEATSVDLSRTRRKKDGLSYKFQRLRERLRTAVSNGELTGKLPGERSLARRFHVNAKTLSKALTDLAAEGLLDRSIGRGTYVKSENSATAAVPVKVGRWLIVCDVHRLNSPLLRLLREANPNMSIVHDVTALRPSFLNQFDAAIDFAIDTPEQFLRNLVVRNLPVVAVNREPNLYSINTVAIDRALGAHCLTRDLILGGHAHIAVVESHPRSVVAASVKQAALCYGPQAVISVSTKDQVAAAVGSGATAVICDAITCAREVRAGLGAGGVRVPQDVSLAAIGCCCADDYPCSGQYVDCAALAQAVTQLLIGGGGNNGHRPTTLWLAPRWNDGGTSGPVARIKAEGEA